MSVQVVWIIYLYGHALRFACVAYETLCLYSCDMKWVSRVVCFCNLINFVFYWPRAFTRNGFDVNVTNYNGDRIKLYKAYFTLVRNIFNFVGSFRFHILTAKEHKSLKFLRMFWIAFPAYSKRSNSKTDVYTRTHTYRPI